jgi:hypothetical protein
MLKELGAASKRCSDNFFLMLSTLIHSLPIQKKIVLLNQDLISFNSEV